MFSNSLRLRLMVLPNNAAAFYPFKPTPLIQEQTAAADHKVLCQPPAYSQIPEPRGPNIRSEQREALVERRTSYVCGLAVRPAGKKLALGLGRESWGGGAGGSMSASLLCPCVGAAAQSVSLSVGCCVTMVCSRVYTSCSVKRDFN